VIETAGGISIVSMTIFRSGDPRLRLNPSRKMPTQVLADAVRQNAEVVRALG